MRLKQIGIGFFLLFMPVPAMAQLSVSLWGGTLHFQEFFDRDGHAYRPDPGFAFYNPIISVGLEYSTPISGVGLPWNPVFTAGTLLAAWKYQISSENGSTGTNFAPAWLWFYGAVKTRYLEVYGGYNIDLGPLPDTSRGQVPITNLSDEVYLAAYGNLPFAFAGGTLTLTAGIDYIMTLKHWEGQDEVDPFDERAPFLRVTYSRTLGESTSVALSLGLHRPTYGPTKVNGRETAPSGFQWTLRPTVVITHKNFSVTWLGAGYISEYFVHGFTISGKNAPVARRLNLFLVLTYTFGVE